MRNGQPLDPPHHDLKTKKLWDAVLADNRDVTWTTLLGRIYTTKTHDYRQYTRMLTAATAQVDEGIANGGDPAAMIDAAIYQALSYRPPGVTLKVEDDDEWAELFVGWDQITLTHTTDAGRRTYHPAPETTRAEADRVNNTRCGDTTRDSKEDATQEPGDGPAKPWTHDPDAPPPF